MTWLRRLGFVGSALLRVMRSCENFPCLEKAIRAATVKIANAGKAAALHSKRRQFAAIRTKSLRARLPK